MKYIAKKKLHQRNILSLSCPIKYGKLLEFERKLKGGAVYKTIIMAVT